MMPPLEFFVNFFGRPFSTATAEDRDRSERGLLKAILFLSDLDYDFLVEHPLTPSIFQSGIRYHHDHGVEKWYGIEESLARGYGDCKVFAAWLIAELHRLGVKAKPHIKWRQLPNGGWMFHCLVAIPHDALPILSHILPFLDVPDDEKGSALTVEPSLIPGDTDWIVDPSRVLGMAWESRYAQTNKRPNSPEFWDALTLMLGGVTRPVLDIARTRPTAAGWYSPLVFAGGYAPSPAYFWPWAPIAGVDALARYRSFAGTPLLPPGIQWQ